MPDAASSFTRVQRIPRRESASLSPGSVKVGLRDIVVEEVSLVDRAANKRRFLIVKRSDDMPGDEELGAEVRSDVTVRPAPPGQALATSAG